MNKEDIKIGDILYWNTTGAYKKPISLKCEVIDIGQEYIWIHVYGNLGPTPIRQNLLSLKPLNKVTNNNIKSSY